MIRTPLKIDFLIIKSPKSDFGKYIHGSAKIDICNSFEALAQTIKPQTQKPDFPNVFVSTEFSFR